MSYGYERGQNPYNQRSNSPGQGEYNGRPYEQGRYNNQPAYGGQGGYDNYEAPPTQSYNRQQYNNAPTMGRDEYSAQNVEMEPLTQSGQQYGNKSNANAFLDQCSEMYRKDGEIDQISNALRGLAFSRTSSLNDPNPLAHTKELDDKVEAILKMFKNATVRLKHIKSDPESKSPRNARHVTIAEDKLEAVLKDYKAADRKYRNDLRYNLAHQYQVVYQVEEDEALRQVDEGNDVAIFSQAVMQSTQSTRRGEAQSTLSAVRSRHEEIAKIERDIAEVAQLFTEMNQMVEQQEAAVTNIEMKGEEVVENMDKGTEQIGVAIKSARNARKWKWWCLGISVLIIVIIVVVILLWQFVFGPNAKSNRDATQNKKRFVLPSSLTVEHRVIPGQPFTGEDLVVPGLAWTPEGTLVSSGSKERKMKRFQA